MTYDIDTLSVHLNGNQPNGSGATNTPIVQSSGFAYDSPQQLEDIFHGRDVGHVYSRISNPTITEFEQRITLLDEAFSTVAVSSGLSAIFLTVMVLSQAGNNIVVSNALFGGTRDLFNESIQRLGVDVRFVSITNEEDVESAIDDNTCAVFTEIISNPKLSIPNVRQLKSLTAKFNIPLIVDATLASSVGFRAKKHGVDVIIYSSTKLMAAMGGAIGGLIVDTGLYDWRKSKNDAIIASSKKAQRFAFIERIRRHGLNNIGINTSPMNAYLTMIGLETLPIRFKKISRNAQIIAEWFESKNVMVSYPGLPSHTQHELASHQFPNGHGPLLTIDLGDKSRAFKFLSQLSLVKIMSNLGANQTIVIHPKSTVYAGHEPFELVDAGVTDGLIRLNIGIEDSTDLINEFKEALK